MTVATLRGQPIPIYTYHARCLSPSQLFMFHGKSRDADAHRDLARRFAKRHCMDVYAPLFDKVHFPGWSYQRGGIVRNKRVLQSEQWTVHYVQALVEWARRHERRSNVPYYLFGHSAGAQFLSRVAAFTLPFDARRIVIANSSSYVLPSLDVRAPYGFEGMYGDIEGERQIREYLRLPVTIYLGQEDTGSEDLVMNPTAMQQGKNRLERGRFVFELARSLAIRRGWTFGWSKVEVPGVGHSIYGMLYAREASQALGLTRRSQRGRARS
jgi:hypothetical protein